MNKKRNFLIFAVCFLFLCGVAEARKPKPPVSECIIPGGTTPVTVTGVAVDPATGQSANINTKANFANPRGNLVEFNVGGAPQSPADPISGTSGSGKLIPSRAGTGQHDVDIKYRANDRNITVRGTIGSSATPQVCTGSGTWSVTGPKNVNLGSGTWTIP